MKKTLYSLAILALALTATSAANAHVNVAIGIDPFGFGTYVPPPVVYQPAPYTAPGPAIYFGGGAWGDDHWRHDRGHDRGGRDHGRRR